MTTLLCLLLLVQVPVAAATAEVIGEVRVHGNHTTPDADILALAGLSVGTPATPEILSAAESRLRASERFADVELRKRYRSLTDPNDVLLIVLVDEHASVAPDDLMPGPLKKLRGAGMWLPILDFSDGYGFTYGARISFVDTLGPRSRISIPMTWGGERRAGVDIDRSFERGPFSRVEGGVSISRRENPHFLLADRRADARVRAERVLTTWLRAGGGTGLSNISFGGVEERLTTSVLDLTVDTRRDPAYPRNAVHATLAWERLAFERHDDAWRRTLDVRGYVGLIGASVLAVRVATSQPDAPLPAYEQALLGGTAELRGYDFGYRADDNLAVMSAEVRVPLTSPLDIGRLGVKGFVDWGTAYPFGAKLGDQTFDRGSGGGVFLTATVLRMGLDVAWPRGSSKPKWHFGLGVTF
jgi:outer membrane protein assembly factor BamA